MVARNRAGQLLFAFWPLFRGLHEECFSSDSKLHQYVRFDVIYVNLDQLLITFEHHYPAKPGVEGRTLDRAVRLPNRDHINAPRQSSGIDVEQICKEIHI